MIEVALDALLGAALLWFAWRLLIDPDLFTAVVLYIAFGLLMALVWVRLAAPDIALAEAAVGAGVTGALMLDAVRQLQPRSAALERVRYRTIAGSVAAILAIATLLAVGTSSMAIAPGNLTQGMADALPAAGATHPVTAVLLDIRAYDTWLETAVLLVAVLAVLVVRRSDDVSGRATQPPDSMLEWLVRAAVPLLLLCAGFLLWLGSHGPGGAFQAGAVAGSAAILLLVSSFRSVDALPRVVLRIALQLGVAAFALVAVGGLATGQVLELPHRGATLVVIIAESAVAVAVAVTLGALFAGARPSAAPGE